MQEELKPCKYCAANSELLTIAYMSGQSGEAARHGKTKEALNALLHYIDHAGTWPEGWDMERVRAVVV